MKLPEVGSFFVRFTLLCSNRTIHQSFGVVHQGLLLTRLFHLLLLASTFRWMLPAIVGHPCASPTTLVLFCHPTTFARLQCLTIHILP